MIRTFLILLTLTTAYVVPTVFGGENLNIKSLVHIVSDMTEKPKILGDPYQKSKSPVVDEYVLREGFQKSAVTSSGGSELEDKISAGSRVSAGSEYGPSMKNFSPDIKEIKYGTTKAESKTYSKESVHKSIRQLIKASSERSTEDTYKIAYIIANKNARMPLSETGFFEEPWYQPLAFNKNIGDASFTLNDPYLYTSGNSDSLWQDMLDLWGLHRIHAPVAWEYAMGEGVTIAIVDSGLDNGLVDASEAHEDILGNIFINEAELLGTPGVDDDGNGFVDDISGWNFVTCEHIGADGSCMDPAERSNDTADGTGHGTHVAGIAAAQQGNGVGIAGVAPQSQVLPVRVLNNGGYADWQDVADGIYYAVDMGARVINMSLGAQTRNLTDEESTLLYEAIQYARAHGAIVVTAAGNTRHSGLSTSDYQPQSFEGVLTIGSVDPDDNYSYFSNPGAELDFVAPGRYILSLIDDDRFRGVPAAFSDLYTFLSGTSMAAPMASGVVALLLSQDPTLTFDDIYRRLRFSAIDLGPPGFDEDYGWGLIDAFGALSHDYYEDGTVKWHKLYEPDSDNVIEYQYDLMGRETLRIFEDHSYQRNLEYYPGTFQVRVKCLYDAEDTLIWMKMFDEDGRLINQIPHVCDGTLCTTYESGNLYTQTAWSDKYDREITTYFVDEDYYGLMQGRISREVVPNSDGMTSTIYQYGEYYENTDQVREIRVYFTESSTEPDEIYYYNESGLLICKEIAVNGGYDIYFYREDLADYQMHCLERIIYADGSYVLYENYFPGISVARYQTHYDAEGNIIEIREYDSQGRLISKVNTDGVITEYFTDDYYGPGIGRISRIISPEGEITHIIEYVPGTDIPSEVQYEKENDAGFFISCDRHFGTTVQMLNPRPRNNSNDLYYHAGDVNGDGRPDLVLHEQTIRTTIISLDDREGIEERFDTFYFIFSNHISSDALYFSELELDGINGFKIICPQFGPYDRIGQFLNTVEIASRSDYNNDGIDDIVVMLRENNLWDDTTSVKFYVVYGSDNGFPAEVNLATMDDSVGSLLCVIDEDGVLEYFMSPAGDFNGDGQPDLQITKNNLDRTGSFITYILFGGDSAFVQDVDLDQLDGENGIILTSARSHIVGGMEHGSDINGDGLQDWWVAVSPEEALGEMEIHVFFQTQIMPSTLNVDDVELNGLNGFVLEGVRGVGIIDVSRYYGELCSSQHDFNSDGLNDLMVFVEDPVSGPVCYVVYGTRDGFPPRLHVDDIDGDNGFVINSSSFGINPQEETNISINEIMDYNGDGYPDFNISIFPDSDDAELQSDTYIVFGQGSMAGRVWDLHELDGANGFCIRSHHSPGSQVRTKVTAISDINGDGQADYAVMVHDSDAHSQDEARVYIVFSSTNYQPIYDLGGMSLGAGLGIVIEGLQVHGEGQSQDFEINMSLVGGRDFNGDGISDLLISSGYLAYATGLSDGSSEEHGPIYVIFGSDQGFPETVNVGDLDGTNGFVIQSSNPVLWDYGLYAVDDINNDGISDFILQVSQANFTRYCVVYGRPSGFPAILTPEDIDQVEIINVPSKLSDYIEGHLQFGHPVEVVDSYVNDEGYVIFTLSNGSEIFNAGIHFCTDDMFIGDRKIQHEDGSFEILTYWENASSAVSMSLDVPTQTAQVKMKRQYDADGNLVGSVRYYPGGETVNPGDADYDRAANSADLDTIRAHWNQAVIPGTCGDVTGDGLVDKEDIDLLQAHWGETVPTKKEKDRVAAYFSPEPPSDAQGSNSLGY